MSRADQPGSNIDRIPPHNLEAEMALLGAVLVSDDVMAAVSGIVRAQDFYAHVHEIVFRAELALYEAKKPLDIISLSEKLATEGHLDKVGGREYLRALMDTVQTAASATYYAKIIREKAVLRALIHAGIHVTALGYEREEDVEAALDEATHTLLALATRDMGDMPSAYETALEVSREIIEGKHWGISSGFNAFDTLTSGLHPGRTYVIGARPGVGKTSFALRIARRVAKDIGPVYIGSVEMSRKDLMHRFIAAEAGIDLRQLSSGELSAREQERALHAASELSKLPVWLDDAVTTVEQFVARARQQHAKQALSLAIVDYVQLLGCENIHRDANTNERVSYASRRLTALAKELSIPLVILSQLNRDVERRVDKRPTLADLRDSGTLEQDAGLVAFLHREGLYDKEVPPSKAMLLVEKNRFGPLGDVDLEFIETCARYQNPGDSQYAA